MAAVKIRIDGEEFWVHKSTRGERCILRRFVDGDWDVVFDGETGTAVELIVLPREENERSIDQCRQLLIDNGWPAEHANRESASIENLRFWGDVFAILEGNHVHGEGADAPPGGAHEGPVEDAPRIIPNTRLRELYAILKRFDTSFQEGMAAGFAEKPESLVRLWEHSFETFQNFTNDEAWFVEGRRDLPDAPDTLDAIASTNSFVAFCRNSLAGNANGNGTMFDGTPLQCCVNIIEREINPRAMRRAQYEDGTSARCSGRGGVDLLLACRGGDRLWPVITEVKVANDSNAFFALIQVLTYAVEFATPNQRRRLAEAYQHLGIAPDGTLDAAIVLLNRQGMDCTLEPTRRIIHTLNERRRCTGLGTIYLLNRPAGAGRWEVHQ